MLRNRRITALQLYGIFMLTIGISNHVVLIPFLLQVARRDSWLGAAAAVLPLAVWAIVIVLTARRTGRQKLTAWLSSRFGKATAVLLSAPLAAFLLLTTVVTLKDIITWSQISYLQQTPKTALAITFIMVCFFAARAGIRTIAISAGILLPVVIALGFLVMTANFKFKDYTLLHPLMTHGYEPMLRAAFYTCGGGLELVLVLFLQHHVSTKISAGALIVLTVILVGLTVGPLTGAIAMFGPFQAAELRYPAFDQWRMVKFGKYISHLDFFSIYQWISGAFARISLMLYLIADIAGMKTGRSRTTGLLVLSVLVLIAALLPVSDMTYMGLMAKWYFPVSFWLLLALSLLLFGLTFLNGRRKEEEA